MEISYLFAKFMQKIQIAQIHNSQIDKSSRIRFGAFVLESSVARNSYIAENTTVLYCDIGSFSSIASDCFIGGASHPTKWVSTSPVFQKQKSVLKKKYSNLEYDVYSRTSIGNDVWIGTNVLIKGGVTIADGAVVGMGSVVTHDVGPYEIWAGNPARLIKKRFDDELIEKLIGLKWWNWNAEDLDRYAIYFDDPYQFSKMYEGIKNE